MKTHWKIFLRILLLVVILRLVLGAWMWGVRKLSPADPVTVTTDMYKGVAREANPWLEPWQRWDTPQYQAIAERGYGAFDTALFTPPLYPLLMRLFTPLAGGSSLLAGMIVAGLACIFCLFALYQLAALEFGDEALAWRAVLYLSTFPTAFFLMGVYTESLFLLGAVMALLSLQKKQWAWAGLWGAVTALSRSPGILIIVPLAYAAWSAWCGGDRKGWLAPFIALAGAALFPAYVFFGMHLPPTTILDAVGRGGHLSFPGWNLVAAAVRIFQGWLLQENLIELAFTALFIILSVFVWKKLPRIYGIYTATFMLLFLTRFGFPQPLVSMARYVLELFPVFLLLAVWGGKPWVHRLVLYLSWLGLLFFSAQFAMWGWVG